MTCEISECCLERMESNEMEEIDKKREWILSKLSEINPRRKTSLSELADHIASRPWSRKIAKLEALKKDD